jgi:hypothetical protein
VQASQLGSPKQRFSLACQEASSLLLHAPVAQPVSLLLAAAWFSRLSAPIAAEVLLCAQLLLQFLKSCMRPAEESPLEQPMLLLLWLLPWLLLGQRRLRGLSLLCQKNLSTPVPHNPQGQKIYLLMLTVATPQGKHDTYAGCFRNGTVGRKLDSTVLGCASRGNNHPLR